MVNTRGSGPSSDDHVSSELPASPALKVEDDGKCFSWLIADLDLSSNMAREVIVIRLIYLNKFVACYGLKIDSDSNSVEASLKPSHPREEDEDGSLSPRASKKRRIEAESEALLLPSQTTELTDQTPGHQIEEELVSALGSGIGDAVERQNDGQTQMVSSAEDPAAPETNPELDDMASVISSIMNHAERVEEQCAMGQQQLTTATTTPAPADQPAPKGLVYIKANSHLKIQSLPILDNLVRDVSYPVCESCRGQS
jgi:hypothetical protein